MPEPYRRRIRVRYRPWNAHGRVGRSIVLDSGHDAPLTHRGRAKYVSAIVIVAIVGVVLIALART